MRIPASVPDSLITTCQAARLVLPGEVAFSHETAALLCDLPVPDCLAAAASSGLATRCG
ncbi:hypothetical protein [Jiangella rhizosphaerae]|uniref:hypothetical protein n=1 Tax=Jiangella rhizosphaerae TaxID=2293569 RepID=UPI0013144F08|nr:hypothetical protein [Jiangella rhizosphaerae]